MRLNNYLHLLERALMFIKVISKLNPVSDLNYEGSIDKDLIELSTYISNTGYTSGWANKCIELENTIVKWVASYDQQFYNACKEFVKHSSDEKDLKEYHELQFANQTIIKRPPAYQFKMGYTYVIPSYFILTTYHYFRSIINNSLDLFRLEVSKGKIQSNCVIRLYAELLRYSFWYSGINENK